MFWVCLVFVPLLCVWMFSIFAVFTRQMSGWAKAAWLVAIVFLPFVGTLLYLILRPGKPASSYYSPGSQRRAWARAPGLTATAFLPSAGPLLSLILRPGKPASSYYSPGYAPRPVYAP